MVQKYFWIIVIFCNTSAFFPLIHSLPSNEYEAREDLEEGRLDSLTWELINEFYADPVHVPLGELRYLADKMPEINEDDIPSALELKQYEPWNNKCIDRFFIDYPQLEKYQPILNFYQQYDKRAAGKIVVSGKTTPDDSCSTQTCRFTSDLFNTISSQGSFYINRNRMVWHRRSIRLNFSDYLEISTGNFSMKPGNGLFFGYFPSTSDRYTLSTDENWLYGSYNTWNGLSAVIKPALWNKTSVFLHQSHTESAGGAKLSFNFRSVFHNYITLSYLKTSEEGGKKKHFIQSGFKIDLEKIRIYGHTGFSARNPMLLPLFLSFKNTNDFLRFEGNYFHIPDGFNTSRSRICHSSRYSLGIKDTLSPSISGFQLSESFMMFKNLEQSVDTRYLISQQSSDFRTRVKFKLDRPLHSEASYGFKITNPLNRVSHNAKLSFNQFFTDIFHLSEEISAYLSSTGYNRYSLKLDCEIMISENILIFPNTRFSFINNRYIRYSFGFKQTAKIYKHIFFEYIVTIPFIQTDREDFYIATNANFIF